MVSEKDRPLFEFLEMFSTLNEILSIISNIFLIWIIMKCSKDLFGYRFLLIVFAVNDIWFPTLHFLTAPVICSYRDAFIMFSNGYIKSKFSICFFGATFSQTMPIMAHLFLYRLVVLRWPHLARYYTRLNTALIFTITLGVQVPAWTANCWFNYNSDEEMQRYVKPFLDAEFPGEGKGHIGTLYWNEEGLRVSAVLSTMFFNFVMTIWSAVIGVCSVLIVRYLKVAEGTSSHATQNLQKQMFKTLVAQLVIPIAFVYVPCAGIINCPMFWHFSVFPNLAPSIVTVFPVGDAVITLIGVKIFRKQCIAYFRAAIGRKFPVSTMVVSGVRSNSVVQQSKTSHISHITTAI